MEGERLGRRPTIATFRSTAPLPCGTSIAGTGPRHHPLTESVGAARHNGLTLLHGSSHSDDPTLFNNGANHTTLHDRADDGPLDDLTNERAGFHKAALHHGLNHLPDHRTALDDLALHYRLDNAPLHDPAFDDPALNAGLIVLIIDHDPLTSTRTVEPVVHDPALHTRAVEVIIVIIKGVAAPNLSLGRSTGKNSSPA
jgi:hypothetical protein